MPKRSTTDRNNGRFGATGRIGTWRIDNTELDLFGLGVGSMGDLRCFASRDELLVVSLEDGVVAIQVLSLHQHPRCRLRDLFDPFQIGSSVVETSL